MNFKNCERCKKPFSTAGTDKNCPSCNAKINEEIDNLSELIHDNKLISLAELIEKSQLSEKTVLKHIQSGKLPKMEGIQTHNCKKCGAEMTITSATYCPKCMLSMAKL